jgi:Domain of unknown function (DUF4440)
MSKENEVLRAFRAVKDALMGNDVETLSELFAEDYRGFNLGGGVDSRALVLEAYQPGSVKLEKAETQELNVEVIGEVGIVSGTAYLCGHFGDHFFEHDFRFMDVFVLRDGKWVYYLSQGTEISKQP